MFSLLLLVVPLAAAKARGSVIQGTVRSAFEVPVPNARVTVQDAKGRSIASASSDARGRFELRNLPEGVYRILVGCAGYVSAAYPNLAVSRNHALTIAVTLSETGTAAKRLASPNALGGVGFYQDFGLKSAPLTDPSAGGGYSDAASAQGSQMIQQYLAPGGASALKPRAIARGGAPEGTSEAAYAASGAALLARRDYRRARPLFTQAVARYPQSARLRTGLGITLYQEGQYAQAAADLGEAARLAPDDASPLVLLAEAVRFAPQSSSKATRLLANFVARRPESARGHYAYGLDLWDEFRSTRDRGSLTSAQSELEKAVALDSTLAAARVQLGVVYDSENVPRRAMDQYREAIRSNPALAVAHYRLAEDAERAGNRAEAAAEFQAYRRLSRAAGK
ncbi:MAG: carboxypeptidase regulatory-like domain-containing protein [Terriglobia bacterium]